ncbi:oxidoreductase family, C-terminal alpha/beta domain protein, partial [Vibrio harveyi]
MLPLSQVMHKKFIL